jgi:multidrug efflux pump subunit AcrB
METDQQFATTPIPPPPNHRFGRGLLGGKVHIGGLSEQSEKATGYILEMVPTMLMIIVILLMIQLQNIPNMILTLFVLPCMVAAWYRVKEA